MTDVSVAQNEDLGQGGVPTPTPEPGPTPTPPEGDLRPAAELLGTPPEPVVPPDPAAPTPQPEPPSEFQKRISQLVGEKHSERRAREAAEARAKLAEETLAEVARLDPEVAARVQAAAGSTPTTPASPTPGAPQQFSRAQVEQMAAAMAAQTQFNRDVDAAVVAGRSVHADYDAAVAGIRQLFPQGPPVEFVQAALATGEASEIIYRLGKDVSEADRLASLPPIQMATQMERLAQGIRTEKGAKAAPEPSRAPAPIAPKVTPHGANVEKPLDDPNLPMVEFLRRRNEQEAARKKRAY